MPQSVFSPKADDFELAQLMPRYRLGLKFPSLEEDLNANDNQEDEDEEEDDEYSKSPTVLTRVAQNFTNLSTTTTKNLKFTQYGGNDDEEEDNNENLDSSFRGSHKRSFDSTFSESKSDLSLALLSSSQRQKPTPPDQQVFEHFKRFPSKAGKDLSDPGKLAGFRPILRQTNSENDLEIIQQGGYKSPRIYLEKRKNMQCSPNYFDKLSDEVVLSVFKFLSKPCLIRCSRVCRRWARLYKDDSLWKRIDLAGKRMKCSDVYRLINRGLKVMRLSRSEIRKDEFDLPLVATARLQYLDMSTCTVSDVRIIGTILMHCFYLRALSLESCDLAFDSLVLKAIGQNRNLAILNLSGCSNLPQAGLVSLFQSCQKLTELNLAWALTTSGQTRAVCYNAPPTLQRLNISGCRNKSLLDREIETLVERCTEIFDLDISDCTDLTDNSLKFISTHLPLIQTLSCSRCYSIVPSSYLIYCKRLRELNVFGTVKEESLPILRRSLKGVTINFTVFSTVARPTIGVRRTSIWQMRTRD